MARAAQKVVRLEQASAARTTVTQAEHALSQSPLYGVAMLKIAMELKRCPSGALEQIISVVLAKMHLPEDDFRAYLSANGGLLRGIAARKRY